MGSASLASWVQLRYRGPPQPTHVAVTIIGQKSPGGNWRIVCFYFILFKYRDLHLNDAQTYEFSRESGRVVPFLPQLGNQSAP